MRGFDVDAEIFTWKDERFDYRIECDPAVLAAAGRKSSGVLFGRLAEDTLRILDFRPAAASHPKLRQVLKSAAADPGLDGMSPVGWFRSTPHGVIRLGPDDLAVFDDNFPHPWQVALIMRPEAAPGCGAFFFREVPGVVRSESPYDEFTLPEAAFDEPELAEAEAPLFLEDETGDPGGQDAPDRRRLWKAAAVLPMLLLVLFLAFREAGGPEAGGIGLRLSNDAGSVRIEWDREAVAVREAAGGRLEIVDGPDTTVLNLDGAELRTGSVLYSRATENTRVRIVVEGRGGQQVEESAQIAGAPPAGAAQALQEPLLQQAGVPAQPEIPDRPEAMQPEAVPKTPEVSEVSQEASRPDPPVTPLRGFRLPAARRPAPEPPAPAVAAPPAIAVRSAEDMAAPPLDRMPRLPEPPRPAAASVRPAAPASGQAIWTGRLERRGVVRLDGQRASLGHLSAPLPGAPASFAVLPGELTARGLRLYTADKRLAGRTEAPGPQNGWNPTEYVWDPARARGISVLEPPGEQNGWKGMILRSESRNWAVVVLRWEAQR